MKNFFSKKLYIEGLRKIRVPGVAAAVTVIALNALLPIIGIIESKMVMPGQVRNISTVPTIGFAPFGLLMMVFGVVFAYSMFSYMNERNKSDFWHAVPDKRTCVYFSFIAAIYTWIVAILLVSGLVNLILWNIAKYYVAGFATFFVTLGVYLLAAIMLVGFMTLAMTLTGTTVSNLLILTLLCLFVRAVGMIFLAGVREVAPMFDATYSILRVFEGRFFLPFALIGDLFEGEMTAFGDVPMLLYSVAVSLLLLALGAIFYVRRRSEMATHSAPTKRAQHVYRCAVTLPFCLLWVYLGLIDADVSLLVALFIVILLVWVIYELMTTKKIKNVWKSLPVLVVPVILSLLFTATVFITRNSIWNDTPDADEIQGVGLMLDNSNTYEQIKAKNVVVQDKALNQLVADALEDTVEYAKTTSHSYVHGAQRVAIYLKSGRTIGRKISLDENAARLLREGFYNSEEYLEAYLSMPSDRQIESMSVSHISPNKATVKRLWESYLSEYSLLTDTEKLALKNYRSYLYGTAEYLPSDEAVGYIYMDGSVGIEDYSSSYPVCYRYTPETAAMLMEYRNQEEGYSGSKATEDLVKLRDTVRSAKPEDGYLIGHIQIDSCYGELPFHYDAYKFSYLDEKESVDNLLRMLDFLTDLKDSENYEAENGKCILILTLTIETNAVLQEDAELYGDRELYYTKEEIMVEYTFLRVPLALTRTESEAFTALWQEITVEKTEK